MHSYHLRKRPEVPAWIALRPKKRTRKQPVSQELVVLDPEVKIIGIVEQAPKLQIVVRNSLMRLITIDDLFKRARMPNLFLLCETFARSLCLGCESIAYIYKSIYVLVRRLHRGIMPNEVLKFWVALREEIFEEIEEFCDLDFRKMLQLEMIAALCIEDGKFNLQVHRNGLYRVDAREVS